MTWAEDEPKDPGQKKIAGLPVDELVRDVKQRFDRVLKISTRAVSELERYDKQIQTSLRDFLLHCFVAETGLKPSRCTLVVFRPAPTTINYFFVEAEPHVAQAKMVNKLYDDITKSDTTIRAYQNEVSMLRQEIEQLRQENRELRWRR